MTTSVRVRDDALTAAEVARLADLVYASGALGESPLGGTFANTRGFGLVFRATERSALSAHHPWAASFLALALADVPDDYACYLNALLVPAGGSVGLHVDTTLREPLGQPDALPVDVTVLYLDAGDGEGGELRLAEPGREPVRIRARAGRLVCFAGHLPHAITPRSPTATTARLSLVLERYRPPPGALANLVPRLRATPPAVDVGPVFAGRSGKPFESLLKTR